MRSHSPDYIFLSSVGILLIFGLVMLISVSSVFSFQNYNGDSYGVIKHQLLYGIIPGLFLFFIFFKLINYKILRKITPLLMLFAVILLILVFIPGLNTGGETKSWLKIPGLFSFQPAEFMKIVFILFLALWFDKRGKRDIKNFWTGFLPFIFWLGLSAGLVILQPDLGTAIIIIMSSLIIYFLAGAKKTHLFFIFLIGIAGFLIFMNFAQDYQKNRLSVFLNPQIDKLKTGYHINQAFLAIGSGGAFGVGFGQSRQKFAYLPEVIGDSIFAIISEELGFVISVGFIILMIFIFLRGFQIAKKSRDTFAYLTVAGIISLFAIQSIVNIGAMVGIMPLTGVTLPFVSYGGSSIAMSLAATGIIGNISRYTKK